MAKPTDSAGSKPRRLVAAFLVGTALSALAPVPAEASTNVAVRDLSRYCTTCWRNARLQPDAWSDCTQEVLCRLLERVEPEHWSQILAQETEERREFLRAIDTVKKRVQRADRPASLGADVADAREPHRRQLADRRCTVLQAARQHLGDRQAKILALSFDGWSVQEISGKLGLPTERVSDEKYKAIQKLRRELGRV